MFLVDQIILSGSLLILIAILSRKFSARFGVPVLVLFLLVGMLAGSEGIGGIDFGDFTIAHGIGTIALVVILFDGGLRTSRESLHMAWKPALSLATIGVFLTAVITGVFASWMLGMSMLEGLLLASIVASTDAAAVFSTLRSQGVNLEKRLAATLEIESASNDPMAIFLTVGLIEVVTGERTLGLGLVGFFLMQMGLGLIFGYVIGRVAAVLINRINLDAAGLYPVLVITIAFAAFGLTAFFGGSGFLAVFVAGVVLGNSSMVYKRGTLLFHDGLAWVSQIIMFVVLGLLVYPSALLDSAWQGLAVGFVLMLVARPISVAASIWPFDFTFKEFLLISWVGLKGAVPIILATFPLLLGVPDGLGYFNVVFFVVLLSTVLQGTTLTKVARMLGLEAPPEAEPPATLDITSLHHVNADIVDYEINDQSAAAHLRISELALPEDVVIAMVTRGKEIIPARGATVLLPGDHAFLILRPSAREAADVVFQQIPKEPELPLRSGIILPGTARLRDVDELYGIALNGDPNENLEQFMLRHLHRSLEEGSFVELPGLRLYVQSMDEATGPVIGIEEAITD